MKTPKTLENTEKTGAASVSNVEGASPTHTTKPDPAAIHTSRHSSLATTLNSDLTPAEQEEAEHDAENLEALAAVPSGPVYSAFGKRKKIYIVFMVTGQSICLMQSSFF